MSYISLDKKQLVNLEYSLGKELLRTNRAGSYASTSIIRCNTRKYHGLLVSRQPKIDNLHHVFLSTLDTTVIQNKAEFNLAIHKYEGNIYEPGGHKYIRDFVSDPIPKITYRVGGVVLTSEMVFLHDQDRILIRYTLVEANSPTTLKFKPLLAFRNIHSLSKKNDFADTSFSEVRNGIAVKMYENYSPLHMQFSKKVKFTHKPDWYYGIEYSKEQSRGYDYKEDLFVPGTFQTAIKKGESIIFSAGLEDLGNTRLNQVFEKEITQRIPRNNFINCLENAAQQFFIRQDDKMELIAGFHWFTMHGRDAFIALPGLTLPQGETKLFFGVIDTMVDYMKGEFFPSTIRGNSFEYYSVDTSLWFFWTMQQYIKFTGDSKTVWEKYGKLLKNILSGYKKGSQHNIHILENGLLYSGYDEDTLTWMNTRINNSPVVNRNGLAIEVNALWYNAIQFYIELSREYKVTRGISSWEQIAEKIELSFSDTFWNSETGHLADIVKGDYKDMAVRPNQVFATSLPYSPITEEMKHLVLNKIKQELLTPRGIRTLSPKNTDYIGTYEGDITARDQAYHRGSAFPWLLGHFADGYLKLHGISGLSFIKRHLDEFEKEMTEAGVGTISELFSGDPPHKGKGAISHAWSVAELLRLNYTINQLEQNTNHDA